MAADPLIRPVGGAVDDVDGIHVITGINHDLVTITFGGTTVRLTADAAAELAADVVRAAFEAGDCAGRLASHL